MFMNNINLHIVVFCIIIHFACLLACRLSDRHTVIIVRRLCYITIAA